MLVGILTGAYFGLSPKEIPITLLGEKHYISRKCFYKWWKRGEKEGDEGLRLKIRSAMWVFKINLRLLN